MQAISSFICILCVAIIAHSVFNTNFLSLHTTTHSEFNSSLDLDFPSEVEFSTVPLVTNDTLQQSIRNQTRVSITLATHLLSKNPHSNVVFSPVSMHVVLSLAAAGSKGRTLDQLLTFLKTTTTDDLNSLCLQIVSSILADGGTNGGPRLSFANGLWVDKTLPLKPSFKQIVDSSYKAACNQVDFQNKAVEVVNEVNLWGEKQTSGFIKEVMPTNSVNKDTRLIFANAIYFKGGWSQNFDRSKTKDSNFHLLDGNIVKVPFMTNDEEQIMHEYDDFKVLTLPYLKGQDKRQFTMYLFLPNAKDGLQSLLEKVSSTSDFIDHHIPYLRVEVGRLLIPKFKISFGFEASDMLKELGLVLPFEDGEDGMTEMVDSSLGESLFVSSIYHKSFVDVNEEGTEAAAVSVKGLTLSAYKPDFVADHPFLFVIREDETGVVLFLGQVIDPSVGLIDS